MILTVLTLRQWRRAKGITQKEMADKLAIHVSTYQKWEKAPNKIRLLNAIKIADILGVYIDNIDLRKEVNNATSHT